MIATGEVGRAVMRGGDAVCYLCLLHLDEGDAAGGREEVLFGPRGGDGGQPAEGDVLHRVYDSGQGDAGTIEEEGQPRGGRRDAGLKEACEHVPEDQHLRSREQTLKPKAEGDECCRRGRDVEDVSAQAGSTGYGRRDRRNLPWRLRQVSRQNKNRVAPRGYGRGLCLGSQRGVGATSNEKRFGHVPRFPI